MSRWTVTRWIAAGLIPAVDIGIPGRPRTRIAEHDLEAFIEARRIG